MALFVLLVIFLAHDVACRNGTVENTFMDTKFECSRNQRLVYTTASEMQCVHKCLFIENCGVLNYKLPSTKFRDNCEVYSLLPEDGSCQSMSKKNWKALILKREEALKAKEYESCKEIYDKNPGSVSGVYKLKSGKHHCVMGNATGCGGGGWTMAMKTNCSKRTFEAFSSYWTNDQVYNVEEGLKTFNATESKFRAFSLINATSLCVGMQFSGSTNWIRIPIKRSSLLDIFKDGTYKSTTLGRNKWKSLIAGSSLQIYCNREGFNVKRNDGIMFLRIGILNNEQNDCATPNSMLGFGTHYQLKCNGRPIVPAISCGNLARCRSDNGDKSSPVMGYILVQ